MLTPSQTRQNQREYTEGAAFCPKCKIMMPNAEPMICGGEFYHPKTECVNSGKIMEFRTKRSRIPTVESFKRKAVRRARDRGARQARKLRPR